MLNKWPKGEDVMNTKKVEPTLVAAHCLYASSLNLIKEGKWMGNFTPGSPELYPVPEEETFDIDEEWQFKVAEILYKAKYL